jgi:hypothetical protein
MKESTLESFDRGRAGKAAAMLAGVALLATLPGCVEVSAPDRPIEINLNINIRQEVVVRLTEDVRELQRREPGVF